LSAFTEKDSAKITLKLEEAEKYFEMAILLTNDEKQLPISGSLSVDTTVGESGGRLTLSIARAEDETATVEVRNKVTVSHTVDRLTLERFWFACREGLCEDLEDDD
jgi:hypothetical protein